VHLLHFFIVLVGTFGHRVPGGTMKDSTVPAPGGISRAGAAALALALAVSACDRRPGPAGPEDPGLEELDPELVARGRDIFRYDDFGDWRFWTDTLRIHELVQEVDPATALSLGLKVD